VKIGKRNMDYKPPFPWFGGKSPVAPVVWSALGDATNYVEPFFGSGAVLFLRPEFEGNRIETVNDADGFVSNFWRAMQKDVEAVAFHADWPVNECDLHARHLWLVGQREKLTEKFCGDADYFDAKAAGWWCWGLCCWIGSGWCSGNGPWVAENGEMVLCNAGRGVNRQRPHLGDAGRGVNRKRPIIDPGHRGVSGDSWKGTALLDYLGWFADRLANVRVCCGDWSRVCGPSVTFRHGLTGVFLDPPYSTESDRRADLYATDCGKVAHDVRRWAIEQGDNPLMRIVLCGYDGEHEMPASWKVVEWETVGGYANEGKADSRGKRNQKRERLWFSPHCLDVHAESEPLFVGLDEGAA